MPRTDPAAGEGPMCRVAVSPSDLVELTRSYRGQSRVTRPLMPLNMRVPLDSSRSSSWCFVLPAGRAMHDRAPTTLYGVGQTCAWTVPTMLGEVRVGDRGTIGCGVNERRDVIWSLHVADVLAALQRRDQVTLVCGPRQDAEGVLDELGRAIGVSPTSLSETALSPLVADTPEELERRLSGRPLLFDLEALCWSPWMGLAPIRFLHAHARQQGVMAVWPGKIEGRSATFSMPGRRDYVHESARGITLITPRPTSFPDQVPFTMERL